MKKTALALALTAALGVAGLAATPTPATAHSHISFGFGIGVRPHNGFFFGPRIFIGPRVFLRNSHPCRNLRIKAEITGSRFWWNRWQQCRFNQQFN
jgi:hypothetical protein